MTTSVHEYPISLLAHINCCDAHVECNAAPRDAVHVFMDASLRRDNHQIAVALLRVRMASSKETQ